MKHLIVRVLNVIIVTPAGLLRRAGAGMKQVNHETSTDNRTEKRKLGDLGETIACKFLMKHGFTIVEQNYLRKWGEIDIVARETDNVCQNKGVLHFVEVKTVSRRFVSGLPALREQAGETHNDWYRPEDNLHPWKLKRLSRAIQTYLMENRRISGETDWQFDVITVYIDPSNGQNRVELLKNIII